MGHVVINVGGAYHGKEVAITQEACEAIQFGFNLSGLEGVVKLKALSAAFISLCNELSLASGSSTENAGAGREFAVAKTNMQTASMWAVLGATKGLQLKTP